MPAPQSPAPSSDTQAALSRARSSARVRTSADWFLWIAGLSVVNSCIIHFGGTINFIAGLGVTQLFDLAFRELPALAVALDVVAVGFFILMGVFARKAQGWAFVLGGIFYLLDGFIFIRFEMWFAVAFHAYALYRIYAGFNELRRLESLAKAERSGEAEQASVEIQ